MWAKCRVNGQASIEERLFLSCTGGLAQTVGQAVRWHSEVEHSVHWVLDVVWGEDDSRMPVYLYCKIQFSKMDMSPLSFHIRHEVTPERCSAVFEAIAEGRPYQHILQSERQEARLRQLGIVAGQELSADGKALAQVCRQKPALWGDLLHFLHYTRWSPLEPTTYAFSWVYRQFVHLLWEAAQILVNDDYLKPAVGTLIGSIETEPAFANVIEHKTRTGKISLSTSSLFGALNWLAALQPPVMNGQHFSRRFFCPTELMVLALGWVARTSGGEPGIDILLSPERRKALCQLCLLDPAALDRTIDWTLPLYYEFIRPGTRAGAYGRFIRFVRWPQLADLAFI